MKRSLWKTVSAFTVLIIVTPVYAGYFASPVSSTIGNNNDTNNRTTPLRITAATTNSSNNVSFHVGRSNNAGFQTSGALTISKCIGNDCDPVASTSISNGESGKSFSVYMPTYVTGVQTGEFYGEYLANNGYYTYVGPISISAPSLATITSHSQNSITDSSVRFIWPSVSGANTYRYQISKSSDLSSNSTCSNCISGGNSTTSGTTVTLSNLEPNTTYYWHVRAGNTVTQQGSNYSSTRSFTTAFPPPLPTPSGLQSTFVDNDSVNVRWNAVSGANTYRYQITNQSNFNSSGDESNCNNCISEGNATTSGTSTRINGLISGESHLVRVRAGNTNTLQGSEWATTSYQNPQLQPKVSNLALNKSSYNAGDIQTLNWQSANQHHYFFYLFDAAGVSPINTSAFLATDCSTAGANGAEGCLGQSNPSATASDSWVIPRNLNSGTYTIRLVVWSSAESNAPTDFEFSAPFSVDSIGFLEPVLTSPANVATSVGITNQDFQWNAISGATDYRIVVSSSSNFGGFNEATFQCDASCQTDTTGGASSFSGFSLSPTTTYYWRVRAGAPNIGKGGDWSSTRSFTTGSVTQGFSPPVLLSPSEGMSNVSLTTQDFSWKPVDGANSYRLVVSDDASFSGLSDDGFTCINTSTCQMHVGTGTTHTGFPLVSGQTYYWRVRAGNTITEQGGTWSIDRAVTTLQVASSRVPTLQLIAQPASGKVDEPMAIRLIARDADNDLSRIEFDWQRNGALISQNVAHGQERTFTVTPSVSEAGLHLKWSAVAIDTSNNSSGELKGEVFIAPIPSSPLENSNTGYNTENLPQTPDALTCQSNGANECSKCAAGPVDLATGAQVESRSLLSVMGVVPIDFTINYHSLLSDVGLVGRGWQLSNGYSSKIVERENGDIIIHWSKNRRNTFTKKTDGTYDSLQFSCRFDHLIRRDNGTFQITQRNRLTYIFDANNRLSRIENHLGQGLNYLFNEFDQLIEVREPVSDAYLTYEYTDGLLTRVYDELNNQVLLEYQNQNLVKITKADGFIEDFTHNIFGQIETRTLDGILVETNRHDDLGRIEWQEDSRSDNLPVTFEYIQEGDSVRTIFTDRTGERWEYLHDKEFRLESVTNPLGEVVAHKYSNTGGTRESTTDAKGYKTGYEYNEYGDKTKTIFDDGSVIEQVFDNRRNMIELIDQRGNSEKFTYDVNNFQISYADKKGKLTTFLPNANQQTTRVETPEGRVTTYGYTSGRRTSETNPEGHTRTTRFDSLGRVEEQSDFGGFKTTYDRDGMGRVLTETDPLNRVRRWAYNAQGLETSYTDAKGHVTRREYDGEGNLRKVIEPSDAHLGTVERLYGVDGEGRIDEITDPRGKVTTFELDALGRRQSMTNALGFQFGTKYDANGNVIESVSPKGGRIRTSYNNLNLVTEVSNRLNQVTRYVYNANQNINQVTDPEGRVTQSHRDKNGNIIRVEFSDNGIESRQSFDEDQTLETVTDPNGNVRILVNNGNGQTEVESTDDGISIESKYNSRLLVREVTNGRNQISTYAYDAATRQIERDDLAGITAFTWDDNNNLLTVSENGVTSTRTVDNRDRVTSYTADGSPETTIGYGFDKNDNQTRVDYPGGGSCTYTYDDANQLTQSNGFGLSAVYVLDGKGRLEKTTYGNGLEEVRRYDTSDRLTRIRLQRTSNQVILNQIEQSFDKSGKVTHVDITPDVIVPLGLIRGSSYNYQSPNRLTDRTYSGDTIVPSNRFDKDDDGNIVTLADQELALSSPLTSASYGKVMQYNARNWLTQAGNYEYEYHAESYRTTLTHVLENTRSTRHYVVNPQANLDQVLIEKRPDGSTRTYVYGYGFIGEQHSDGEVYYHHHDYRGSVIAVSNQAGEIIARFGYTDYGQRFVIEGNFDTSFGFNGRDGVMTDPNGLLYARARYISPNQARFLAKDPLRGDVSDLTALNRYAYVGGDPINVVDPSGQIAFIPIIPIAAFKAYSVYATAREVSETLSDNCLSTDQKAFRLGVGLTVGRFTKSLNAVRQFATKGGGGAVSKIEDVTQKGSKLRNIKTDVPKSEFEKNLLDNGFKQNTSKDGLVNVFNKGDKTITTRTFANSTKGPTAETFVNKVPKTKIRLGSE